VGTITATSLPFVVLTSNRTRELHDALKRRCLYHWIGYPDLETEVKIVKERAPDVPERISRQVAALVANIRTLDLIKHPGVAETISWARALSILGVSQFNEEEVLPTLGAVLKERDDIARVGADLEQILRGTSS
jgi:MoxR-like ATPase